MELRCGRRELVGSGSVRADAGSGEGKKGGGEKEESDAAGGAQHFIVQRVCGVVEERVVNGAQAGQHGHADLDPGTLIDGGNDVEGCKREREGGRCDGAEDEGSRGGVSRATAQERQQAKQDGRSKGVGAHDRSGCIGKPQKCERDGDGGK